MSASKGKIARDSDHAFEIQETYKGLPHAWIQWKGTEVCMDVYCKCGAHLHCDAEFAYNIKCTICGTSYMCNGHIELIKLQQEPKDCLIELGDD